MREGGRIMNSGTDVDIMLHHCDRNARGVHCYYSYIPLAWAKESLAKVEKSKF